MKKLTLIVLLGCFFAVGCGQLIYEENKNLIGNRGEFNFILQPSDQSHNIYFVYDYEGKSFRFFIHSKLIFPSGRVVEDRTMEYMNFQGVGRYSGKVNIASLIPKENGQYSLMIVIDNPKIKLTHTGIQVKKLGK